MVEFKSYPGAGGFLGRDANGFNSSKVGCKTKIRNVSTDDFQWMEVTGSCMDNQAIFRALWWNILALFNIWFILVILIQCAI